jgi:uncharacterized membrane protein YfcA
MTFPLLMASGMSSMQANASNSVALYPAYVVGGWVYRNEMRAPENHIWLRLAMATLGGGLGTWAFVALGGAAFHAAIPWLLVFATTSFALGPLVRKWISSATQHAGPVYFAVSLILEFITYIYGGYFGLGMGIMLLAIHAIFNPLSVHHANAIRTVTIAVMSLIGIIINAWARLIVWLPSFVMMAGTIVGGYGMANLVRNTPASVVRGGMLVWSIGLTIWSFWHYG